MSDEMKKEVSGLKLLRVPFEKHQISKLPKPTKAQTDEVKSNFQAGIRCKECGGWHHPKVVHLDYVGHAALTDRLLSCDDSWNWEPLAFNPDNTPKFDNNGGLWIKLTVCGVSRIGYGHPDGKSGGDAIKETIGDALRNAAMRFGAALDLWHKGDLHLENETQESQLATKPQQQQQRPQAQSKAPNDTGEWIIELGPQSKLSGTRLKDHDMNFLIEQRDNLLAWYTKMGKNPHENVLKFADALAKYIEQMT